MQHPTQTGGRGVLVVICALAFSLAAAGQETRHPYSSAARPRRAPQQASGAAALLGKTMNAEGRLLMGVRVLLTPAEGKQIESRSAADGIFRVPEIPPGKYRIMFELAGFQTFTQPDVTFNAGEALMIAVRLHAAGSGPATPSTSSDPAPPGNAEPVHADFRELTRRPVQDLREIFSPEIFPDTRLMSQDPDRWDTTMPEWRRYSRDGEF